MTGAVRPFEARVVRQEWAAQAVTPMVDALGDRQPPAPVPASAYDDSPRAFYVYRMRRGSDDHVGVVADVRLDAFAGGGIRGHESVDPQRVDALVRYYADLPARSEPVALLHAHRPAPTRRVADICGGRPLLHFPGPDGLEHTVWRVTGDEETAELADALGEGVHYIADGHHRVAARLRAWEGAGRPAGAGVLCMLFAMDGLAMSAFHRRVSGPVDAAALLDAAAGHFAVRRVPAAEQASGIGMYVAGSLVRPGPDRPASRGRGRARRVRPAGPPARPGAGHLRAGRPPARGAPRPRPARAADGAVRRGRRGAVRPAAARPCARLTRIADLGRADAPQDDVLRAQAVRRDLPHLIAGVTQSTFDFKYLKFLRS